MDQENLWFSRGFTNGCWAPRPWWTNSCVRPLSQGWAIRDLFTAHKFILEYLLVSVSKNWLSGLFTFNLIWLIQNRNNNLQNLRNFVYSEHKIHLWPYLTLPWLVGSLAFVLPQLFWRYLRVWSSTGSDCPSSPPTPLGIKLYFKKF